MVSGKAAGKLSSNHREEKQEQSEVEEEREDGTVAGVTHSEEAAHRSRKEWHYTATADKPLEIIGRRLN